MYNHYYKKRSLNKNDDNMTEGKLTLRHAKLVSAFLNLNALL
jgi:hypothetical protein